MDEVKWMPIATAINSNTVIAIKEISRQLMDFPRKVWGGSFLVSHVGDDQSTKMVEEFYPLYGGE